MKKTAFTYILLLMLAVIIVLATGCSSETEKVPYEIEKKVFAFQTAEQIIDFCEEKELETVESEGFQVVYDVNCFDHPGQVFYGFDEQNQIDSIISYVLLYGYADDKKQQVVPYSAGELQQKCVQVLEELCKMHGVELQNNFAVFNYETLEKLDITKEDTYQKLKDGTAYLEFTLLDQNDYYWMVTSLNMPDGAFFLLVEKFNDASEYEDLVPNIKVQ